MNRIFHEAAEIGVETHRFFCGLFNKKNSDKLYSANFVYEKIMFNLRLVFITSAR